MESTNYPHLFQHDNRWVNCIIFVLEIYHLHGMLFYSYINCGYLPFSVQDHTAICNSYSMINLSWNLRTLYNSKNLQDRFNLKKVAKRSWFSNFSHIKFYWFWNWRFNLHSNRKSTLLEIHQFLLFIFTKNSRFKYNFSLNRIRKLGMILNER